MKRPELIFNFISIPVDIIALIAAGLVAFYLRYRLTDVVGKVLFELRLEDFGLVLLRIIPLLILVFAMFGLYNLRGTRRFIHEFNRIVAGITLGMFGAMVLFFFNQSIFPSRFIILAAWVLSIVFVIVGRFILKQFQVLMFARGLGLHRLVVIKGQSVEFKVVERVLRHRSTGYEIVAELADTPDLIEQLETLTANTVVDEIMQANASSKTDQNLQLAMLARNRGIQFSFIPNLFEVQRNVVELNNLKGIPVISLKNSPLDGWGKVTKRILDLIMSTICLIITAPLMLALAIIIKLNSPGPIIYSHIRTGHGKNFRFYKFRTMFTHLSVGEKYGDKQAEEMLQQLLESEANGNRNGPLHKIKNDPRVTSVGRFLRRTKLDELPQFWNVLKGDMSMVGPRPHLPEQVQAYLNSNRRIFSIKPAIFGLTQIAQITWPTLPFEEEIRLDTYYIENWSLWLDFTTLLKSFYLLFWGGKTRDDY